MRYVLFKSVDYHIISLNTRAPKFYSTYTASVIRGKGEPQNGGNKKTKHVKFCEKTNIPYPLIGTRT